MRSCTIETVAGDDESIGKEWKDLHPSRTIKSITACSFEFAEETIALIEYEDDGLGTFYEVGIGESLRPYHLIGNTGSARSAEDMFWQEVTKHVRSAF